MPGFWVGTTLSNERTYITWLRIPLESLRPKETPYAIYSGYGPFGNTELRVLKTYQVRAKEDANPYARWFVAVKSDMTHGSYDMGDSYIRECLYGCYSYSKAQLSG
jgi:hypothetical protein